MESLTLNIAALHSQFCEDSRIIRNLSPCTIVEHRSSFKAFCAVTNAKQLSDFNLENLRFYFFHGRTERNWATTTYRYHWNGLSAFGQWCVKQGLLSENPLKKIDKPRVIKRIPKKLTRDEAFKLIEVSRNYPYKYQFLRVRNYTIMALLIFTGLRRTELLNLRLQDVNILERSLFIKSGKGDKDRLIPIPHSLN